MRGPVRSLGTASADPCWPLPPLHRQGRRRDPARNFRVAGKVTIERAATVDGYEGNDEGFI